MSGKFGENVIIGENVTIGRDVEVGNNVIIKSDVQIGSGAKIEDNVILGYKTLTKLRKDYQNKDLTTIIGEGSLIRSGAIIYAGCKIGKNSFVNHNAVLREFTELGDQSSIGNLVMCEGYTKIGNRVVIHSQCHLTAKMIIENCVFMGPKVTTGNDRQILYLRWFQEQKVIEYMQYKKEDSSYVAKELAVPFAEPLKVELEAFVNSVIENREPPVTGEDGLAALKVAQLCLGGVNQE